MSSLNPCLVNGLNLHSYANNSPISIAYSSSNVGGTTNGGMVNSIGLSTDMSYVNILDNISHITFPSLYDTLGFVSNLYDVLNGIKVAKYLTHIHGNPPNVKWFLDNLGKHGKNSRYLGYAAAAIDGINVYMDTNDFWLAIWTAGYDVGSMIISSHLGVLIAGLIGGPAGAIIGTVAGIGIDALIQHFKDDVVNWIDKTIDDLIAWASNGLGEMINA